MTSSQPAETAMRHVIGLLYETAGRLSTQKQRSAFSLTVTLSHSNDPVGAAINPFGLDVSRAEGYDTVTIGATPMKKMIPPASLAMHVWRQHAGASIQPVLMVEVQDENTGNLYQKFNLEQKPLRVMESSADDGPAIEAAVTKWLGKWIKAIDKEIDHRMKTEG